MSLTTLNTQLSNVANDFHFLDLLEREKTVNEKKRAFSSLVVRKGKKQRVLAATVAALRAASLASYAQPDYKGLGMCSKLRSEKSL
jgi:hypothetical protein